MSNFPNVLPDEFYSESEGARLPELSIDLRDISTGELLLIQKQQLMELIIQVQKKPRPNYDIDGQKILWGDYLKMLYGQLKVINALMIEEEGPSEETTIAWS